MLPSATLEQVSEHHTELCEKAFQKNSFFYSQSKKSIVWRLSDTRNDWQMYLLHRKISPRSRLKLNFTSQDCSKVCVMAFSRHLQTCVILCLTSNWHLFFFQFSIYNCCFQLMGSISKLQGPSSRVSFQMNMQSNLVLAMLTEDNYYCWLHFTRLTHEGTFHQGATMSSISSHRIGCFSSLTVGRVTYFCFTQKACWLLPV